MRPFSCFDVQITSPFIFSNSSIATIRERTGTPVTQP